MSILKVDTINEKTSGNGVAIPGHIIQVKNKNFTGTVSSTTFDTHVDFGLNVSITPKQTNSNWLIIGVLHSHHYTSQNDWPPHFTAFIGSNPAQPVGDTISSLPLRPNVHVASWQPTTDAAPINSHLQVLDTTTNLTAGTAYTFSIKAYTGRGSGTWFINRGNSNYNDDISGSNPISAMTVMEIAQ